MSVELSIIIPAYNRRKYVVEAVDSVLGQAGVDFEVIVIDDGSTDGSWELLCELYGDNQRVRLARQENAGVAAARNAGIKMARGEYVAFLDSDDLMLPGSLQTRFDLFAALPDSVGLVFGDFYRSFEDGKRDSETFFSKFGFLEKLTDNNLVAREMSEHVWRLKREFVDLAAVWYSINTQTVVIRRDIFAKTGLFDESMDRCEDWDLYLRIAMVTDVACLTVTTVVSRMWIGGLTSDSVRTWQCVIDLLHRNLHRVDSKEAKKAVREKIKATHYKLAYSIYLGKGSRVEVFYHAFMAAVPPGVSGALRLCVAALLPDFLRRRLRDV